MIRVHFPPPVPAILVCSARNLGPELGRTLLWRHDLTRTSVLTPRDALEALRRGPFDLVVIDGQGDVVAALHTFRSEAAFRAIPVAVLLPEGSPLALACTEAGASDVLTLPPDPDWDERLLRLLRIRGRKEARYAAAVEVDLTARDGSRPLKIRALNVSASGMLVSASEPLPIGQQLRISFLIPGVTLPISGTGWVVRDAGRGEFGLEFLYLDGDGLERVRHFVENWVDG